MAVPGGLLAEVGSARTRAQFDSGIHAAAVATAPPGLLRARETIRRYIAIPESTLIRQDELSIAFVMLCSCWLCDCWSSLQLLELEVRVGFG